MVYNVPRLFQRKNIIPTEIKYLKRVNPNTVIYLFDGREVATATPLKELLAHLPEADFLNVSKGVALRRDQIVHISDEGLYTMTDGVSFQGRRRNPGQHKKTRKLLHLPVSTNEPAHVPMDLLEKCTLLDELPMAFCLIELVFDENGHGVDFVFRYCNHEMENVEGVPLESMLNHSFYEVFSNGDKKWLVVYADVALNATRRVIHDFSPEVGKSLSIHCYSPAPGYCACVLIPEP